MKGVITVKNFKNILAAIFLIVLTCATPVEAKIVTDKVPLLTFADAPVTVYDSPNGQSKGLIPEGSSLVLVKEIRSDGWAYGSYKPSDSPKRIYRWFKMTELQGDSNFENYTDQLNNDTNVFRTRTEINKFNGNAPSNEDVTVVSKRGSKTKIIFKADGDYYRMGWVSNNQLKSSSTSSSTGTSDTSGNNTGTDAESANPTGSESTIPQPTGGN